MDLSSGSTNNASESALDSAQVKVTCLSSAAASAAWL